MSTDDVDIIHAAEDYAETLRQKARAVTYWRHRLRTANTLDYPEVERAFQDALLELDLNSQHEFMRPGCDLNEETGQRQCDEDCGGYHDWEQD